MEIQFIVLVYIYIYINWLVILFQTANDWIILALRNFKIKNIINYNQTVLFLHVQILDSYE